MSWGKFAWLALLAGLVLGSAAAEESCAPSDTLCQAQNAWRAGDIDQAQSIAGTAAKTPTNTDAANHILATAAYVKGDYEEFLRLHAKIAASYADYAKLDAPAIEALKHLGRSKEALAFARSRGKTDDWTLLPLEAQAQHPLKVRVSGTSVVPFTSDALSAYLPGVPANVNGKDVTARIDTGGTFLLMSSAVAGKLGIALGPCRQASASLTTTKSCFGLANLVVGGVTVENAPVTTSETLTSEALGGETAVVIGTNFFEHVLATIDTPAKRLILSARRDRTEYARHMKLLASNHASVPFYLWGDHYTFARGSIGDRAVNFFVDLGLVDVSPEGEQSSLLMAQDLAPQWSADPASVTKSAHFRLSAPLSLGAVSQPNALVFAVPQAPVPSLGGVRIDALLSYGFLKRYAWTIDFDRREIQFSN